MALDKWPRAREAVRQLHIEVFYMIRGIAMTAAFATALALDAIGLPAAAAEPAAAPSFGAGPLGGVADRRKADDEQRHDEIDMLERARAEQSRHAAPSAEQPAVGHGASQPDDTAEAIRSQAIDVEVRRRLQEAEREVELDEVSARIRQSAANRAPAEAAPPQMDISETDGPKRDGRLVTEAPELESQHSTIGGAPVADVGRTTLLLVMRPGRNGIRALNPTADPIVCVNDICWVSRGPDRDARMVPRRKALGPLNTLGERAGACNGSTGCVFRNVELGGVTAVVQPVDLRVIRHDRRAPMEVRIDRTCRVDHGRLDCELKAASGDYLIWAVPETTAQAAGARALMSAVGARLRTAARKGD